MTILPKILVEKDEETAGPSSSESSSSTRFSNVPSPPSPGGGFFASGPATSTQREKPYLSESWEVERRDGGRRRRRVQARPAPRSPVDNRERKNSDDEYDSAHAYDYHKEKNYEKRMKEKKGFVIRRMVEDGACLFRAVADQIYGDQEMHGTVRTKCMDYMLKNRDYFSQFVTEDYICYVNRKRQDECYGNQLEMQAMSEMFGRPLEVYIYSLDPMKTLKCEVKTDSPPIRLSYHRSCHYNSVRDPYEASVGVGLGLPGHKPGMADQQQLQQGLSVSEADYIERIMMQDKLACTDLEATGDAITAAITRESYMEWVKANQSQQPSSSSSSTPSDEVPGCSSSSGSSSSCRTPPHSSKSLPPPTVEPSSSASSSNLYGEDDDYDEEKMLEAAIALSRAEYINKLHRDPPS